MDVVRVIVLVIMMVLCALQTAAERESFTVPPPTCPSETVTFTCTVNDSNYHNSGRLGTTSWQVGNSPACALPHADPEIIHECGPNDAFEARSQPPHGGYYTSALQVTAHPSLNGSMVRCYVFDGRGQERTVGRGRLKVIGAPPAPSFLPPNESDIVVLEESVNVTVRWSEPHGYRHNITSYNITANCTMPSQGSSWVEILTVQDSQKMMTFPVGTVATLTVSGDVCDTLVSNESEALELCIEVPRPVAQCSATAVCNGSSAEIVVIWYQAEVSCPHELMAPGLSGNVSSYTIFINKQTMEQEYICTTNSKQCSYTQNVASREIANYTVSVAANNVIGQSDTVYCTTTSIVLEDESQPAEVIQSVNTMLSTTTPSTGSAVNSLPPGVIVVLGVMLGLLLLAAGIGVVFTYLCCRKKKKFFWNTQNGMPVPPNLDPEQREQKGEILIRLNEIDDSEGNGGEHVDGDGSSEDGESDEPRSKNVVRSKIFNRSHSAPHNVKSDISDPSQSLLPNTVNESDLEPTRSLPSNIMRLLGRVNRHPSLSEDQCPLLKNDSRVK